VSTVDFVKDANGNVADDFRDGERGCWQEGAEKQWGKGCALSGWADRSEKPRRGK